MAAGNQWQVQADVGELGGKKGVLKDLRTLAPTIRRRR
jgi:hypothetical protein